MVGAAGYGGVSTKVSTVVFFNANPVGIVVPMHAALIPAVLKNLS